MSDPASETTDLRIEAVRKHFQEWHGAAPDDAEITALLLAIDESVMMEFDDD